MPNTRLASRPDLQDVPTERAEVSGEFPIASISGAPDPAGANGEAPLEFAVPVVRFSPRVREVVPIGLPHSSVTAKLRDSRAGVLAFAGFGPAPETLLATPTYALRVLTRRYALRRDLEIARVRRIQDVELYVAALGQGDNDAVWRGIGLLTAICVSTLGAVSAAMLLL